jgi:hypothetical protein
MATLSRASATVSTSTPTPDPEGRGPTATPLRFGVEEYYRLAEVGILKPDVRSELIEGVVYLMSPIGSPHAACVDSILHTLIAAQIAPRAIFRVQGPFRIEGHSEPEPDLLLLRPRPDFYRTNHPGPADVLLLVEVMVTTAEYDRGVKLPLYARAGVPEVWLVDVGGGRVEVYRRPEGGAYAEASVVARGGSLAPTAFPDAVLAVDALLG